MNKNRWFLILSLVIVIYSVLTLFLISSNLKLSTIDAPNHAMFSVQFYGAAKAIFSDYERSFLEKALAFKDIFFEGIEYWPRLLNLTSLFFIQIFGLSIFSIKMANILYLIILMIFSYLTAIKLGASNKEAVLATAVLPLYPIVLRFLQSYGLDFPLMSISVLFFFLLLKTDGFKNTFYSILAGLTLGVGLLIKGQIVIFAFFPALIYLIDSVFKEYKNKDSYIPLFHIFANLSLFLILSFQIGGLWWRGKYQDLIYSLREHIFSNYRHLESIPYEKSGSLSYYLFYFKYLYLSGFGPMLSTLSIVPIFRYIFSRSLPYKKMVIAWLLFPVLAFSFLFQVHHLRYIMPLVPFIVIITILGSRFKNVFWTVLFRSSIIAVLIFRIFLLVSPDKNEIYRYNRCFSLEYTDRVLNNLESSSSEISNIFFQNLNNYLEPGRYNCIIISSSDVEDGPCSLQFWIEMESYHNDYLILTHDLYDQWGEVYRWWKENPGRYIVLYINDRSRKLEIDRLFDKRWLLENAERLVLHIDNFKDDPAANKLLDDFFPLLRRDAIKISDFNLDDYHCIIYEYENVPATY